MMKRTIIGAVSVTAILSPVTAHADPSSGQVDTFLNELQQRGVQYSTTHAIVNTGVDACNALRGGNSVQSVVNAIHEGGDFSHRDSGLVVGAAVGSFCPDEWPIIQAFVQHGQGGGS
ncbi:DUF732 domain-containing protein [Mycobacterium sp. OTB74]|jgi:hypothetical protein|uniref:DUF732 domain-containing protein n=1 Tax=Mycobacterium sp. OTB74 TaxID=1853452 RepID=UPI002475653F|nr:DUF732 domain-containing protein [Mycobacterium sp. OTB74]MDH6247539.1 guanyl-specific ribonuclease Sa [Mycobacterium sp. OTB74]